MLKYFIFSLLILSVAGGCEFAANKEVKENYFFPLKEFMDREIRDLKAEGITIRKTAMINEEEEVVAFHVVEDSLQFPLQTELGPFLDADINKPAFRDRYSTETDTLGDGRILQVHRAQTDDLATRALKVWRQKGEVQKIEIRTESDNAVYKTIQHLTYEPGIGYSIKANQKVLVTGAKEYFIQGEFLKGENE